MSELILSARGIGKRFDQGKLSVEVLRGIDFDVRRGETVAIIGASGSGKSTLLHLLGTLDHPDEGDIKYDGRSIVGLDGGGRETPAGVYFVRLELPGQSLRAKLVKLR